MLVPVHQVIVPMRPRTRKGTLNPIHVHVDSLADSLAKLDIRTPGGEPVPHENYEERILDYIRQHAARCVHGVAFALDEVPELQAHSYCADPEDRSSEHASQPTAP